MKPVSSETRRFRYLLWSAGCALVLITGIAVWTRFVDRLDMIYMENGPLENMALALWTLSAVVAAAAYRRWAGPLDRRLGLWLAWGTCLAMLREVDAHTLLNPAIIGRFGIHYRVDWLLDLRDDVVLKLAYLTLASLLAYSLIIVPWRLRREFWSLFVAGDAAVGMFAVAALGILLGYTMDDLFRYSPLMTKAMRQLIEESGELCGALGLCAASLLLWRVPFSQRLSILASVNPSSTPETTP